MIICFNEFISKSGISVLQNKIDITQETFCNWCNGVMCVTFVGFRGAISLMQPRFGLRTHFESEVKGAYSSFRTVIKLAINIVYNKNKNALVFVTPQSDSIPLDGPRPNWQYLQILQKVNSNLATNITHFILRLLYCLFGRGVMI